MPSKFGGVAMEEAPAQAGGSRFGGIPIEEKAPQSGFWQSVGEMLNPVPALKEWWNRPEQIGHMGEALKVLNAVASENPENKGKKPGQWKSRALTPDEQAIVDRGLTAQTPGAEGNILADATAPGAKAAAQASEENYAGAAGTIVGGYGVPAAIPAIVGAAKGAPGAVVSGAVKAAAPEIMTGVAKVVTGAAADAAGVPNNLGALVGLSHGMGDIVSGVKSGIAGGKKGLVDFRAAQEAARAAQEAARRAPGVAAARDARIAAKPDIVVSPQAVPDATPIPAPGLPSGRVPGPAPQPPAPAPRSPRPSPPWSQLPDSMPPAAVDATAIPAELPSGRKPGGVRPPPPPTPAQAFAQELTGSLEGGTIPARKMMPAEAFKEQARATRAGKVEVLAKHLNEAGIAAEDVARIPKVKWRDISDALGIPLPKELAATTRDVQTALKELQKVKKTAPVVFMPSTEGLKSLQRPGAMEAARKFAEAME